MIELSEPVSFFATTPKGLELLLVDELRALGAKSASEKLAGVVFSGDLALAYKVNLWSRLANKILFPLTRFPAKTPEELYVGMQKIAWDEHIDPTGTFAIHCVCSQSAINHSLFAAQKMKDAVVDQFRQKFAVRPSVARQRPEVSLHVYLHRDVATVSIDLSGESLHKRGYRIAGGEAPLKENLAAAILLRAGWTEIAKQGGGLLDPMCGSGTLLIEAAMLAGDIAPGLLRQYFGFLGWKKHQPVIWDQLLLEAEKKREQGLAGLPEIVGYDNDKTAIKIAFENIDRAGLRGKIHVEKRELSVFSPKSQATPGLIVVNPPYGERIGEVKALQTLYTLLGDRLKQAFCGWQAALLTGNPELGKEMGLRANRNYALFNGALACKLLLFNIQPEFFVDRSPKGENERRIRMAKRAISDAPTQSIQMFINRIRKKLKHLQRVANRSGIPEYRLYDADIPEYAFAIDMSHNAAHVKEYKAPKSANAKKVLHRRHEVLSVLPEILNLPPEQIFFTELDGT